MADIINVNTSTKTAEINAYLKNRLKYHAASRLASQTGEGLGQALNVDGHIVTSNKIWAASQTDFPNNADKANVDPFDATTDLVNVFKYGLAKTKQYNNSTDEQKKSFDWGTPVATSKNFWNGGIVWTNDEYPAVCLYENVPMTTVKGSDGGGKFQSYEVLDQIFVVTKDKKVETGKKYYSYDNDSEEYVQLVSTEITLPVTDENVVYQKTNPRIVDWVAPTAVADGDTGKVVAGFSGIPMYNKAYLAKDTTRWAATLGTWEFVYMAGMLTFEPGYTPYDKANGVSGEKLITLTAFKYVGDYLDSAIDKSIANAKTELNQGIANAKTELNQGIADAKAEIATTINNLDKTLMAIKPFTWEANNETMQFVYKAVTGLEIGADITGKVYYELSGEEYALTADATAVEGKTYYQYLGKKIEIPAVVFNVFNASTGIAYGDITYLEGGKTEVFFEDWNDDMFGGEKTFVAYGFVLGNGNPINVLALGDLNVYSSSSSAE